MMGAICPQCEKIVGADQILKIYAQDEKYAAYSSGKWFCPFCLLERSYVAWFLGMAPISQKELFPNAANKQ